MDIFLERAVASSPAARQLWRILGTYFDIIIPMYDSVRWALYDWRDLESLYSVLSIAFLLFAKALLSVTPLFPIWRVIATRQNCSVGFMLFHFCFL